MVRGSWDLDTAQLGDRSGTGAAMVAWGQGRAGGKVGTGGDEGNQPLEDCEPIPWITARAKRDSGQSEWEDAVISLCVIAAINYGMPSAVPLRGPAGCQPLPGALFTGTPGQACLSSPWEASMSHIITSIHKILVKKQTNKKTVDRFSELHPITT